MTEFSRNQDRKSIIKNNPKIKLLKKNSRKRSLLENFESETTFNNLDEIVSSVVDDVMLDENIHLSHLRGRYERYWLDRTKNLIHKDILVIRPSGEVVVRSHKAVLVGVARYVLNSQLQLDILVENDELEIAHTLLAYVGRHEISDIHCLHALRLSTGADLSPQLFYEILIPIQQNDSSAIPQLIEFESLEFLKLRHRFPELYPSLQRNHTTAPAKVEW